MRYVHFFPNKFYYGSWIEEKHQISLLPYTQHRPISYNWATLVSFSWASGIPQHLWIKLHLCCPPPRQYLSTGWVFRWYLSTKPHTVSGLWVGIVLQLLSHIWLFVIPWTTAHQYSLSFIISQSLLKFMSIELAIPSNHLILCRPLLFLPSIFPSIRVFSNELALCIRCPKHWSFSFSISLSNEYSGLIFFRIDWFHLLAVQGTLESLL